MAHLFAATVLLALACVASASFQQATVYTSSSCSGSPSYYAVLSLSGSTCTTAGCGTVTVGGLSVSGTVSCPTTIYSGLPSGKYVASQAFSAANCTSASASWLSAYPVGACVVFDTISSKYTCDSNNNPSYTTYSDAACTNNPTTITVSGSCSNDLIGSGSTSYSCISAASGLTASISLIAGAIFAVVAMFITQ